MATITVILSNAEAIARLTAIKANYTDPFVLAQISASIDHLNGLDGDSGNDPISAFLRRMASYLPAS